MDTIKSKAKRQPPYKSIWFWVLPSFTLIAVFTLISLAQNVSGFSEGLKNTLETYQLPLALVVFCVTTLIQWLIAHNSNKLSELEEQQVINRHLRDEYAASERLLIKQFGKFSSDRAFTFISTDDLPAIHSKVYAEDRLIQRGKLSICDEAIRAIDYYFRNSERVLEEALNLLQNEEAKETPNRHIKESVIIQLIQYLNQCALTLHYEIGMRVINLERSDINAYQDAFFETLHLTSFFGGELAPIVNRVVDTPSTEKSNSQEDIQNMFVAAHEIAESLVTSSEGATFGGLYRSIQLRSIIKQTQGSPLYLLACQVIQDIVLEPLLDESDKIGAVEVDDNYPKYDIYNQAGEKKLTLDYKEVDENTLTLTLSGEGENIKTTVRFVDSEKKKFEVDRDMGGRFTLECKKAINRHLVIE
jgi:HSP20 family molecular chaperone IbpA